MIHQELLKVPGDVVTPDWGPQNRRCVFTDHLTGEGTTGLQGINKAYVLEDRWKGKFRQAA